ncbi:hypothetical protein [Dokdonia sp.]|uniref:hypothetical protein n=1 Tax=Dokdonia sp. TaxID=2024995 RepID=UPI0032643068
MKMISKIACIICILLSFHSYGQQTQNVQKTTIQAYNFNTGAIRSHSGFALTLGKKGISAVFDQSYGLARHIDLTQVTNSYKQNLLSDTFVDTSFIYKKEIPGTAPYNSRRSLRGTNLESFIVTGLINTFFN